MFRFYDSVNAYLFIEYCSGDKAILRYALCEPVPICVSIFFCFLIICSTGASLKLSLG